MERALEKIHQMSTTVYGNKFLESKVFLHIHPWGFGEWHSGCSMDSSKHVKMNVCCMMQETGLLVTANFLSISLT